MSMVAPNGTIRFLRDVPLENDYSNTLYFDTITQQEAYFLSLTPVHTMYQCTRVRNGVIRVNALSDNLLMCNYLMFQNQNFSGKWFYAFINDVRYINNSTSEIYYTIDDIQTWFFDVTLSQCMIERQHTETDGVYSHTLGEDVGAPELKVSSNIGTVGFSNSYDAIVFTSGEVDVDADTGDADLRTASIHCYNNLLTMSLPTVSASQYILDGNVRSATFDDNSVLYNVLSTIIDSNYGDAIIGGVIIPTEFANTSEGSQGTTKYYTKSQLRGSIDGYTPKNNKLYNSPYCVLRIQLSDGQNVFLQPEYLDGNYITLRYIPVVSMTPELAVIPMNYKGQEYAYSEALSFTSFPQFSIAVDGYKAWVASGGLAKANLSLSQSQRTRDLANEEAIVKGVYGMLGSGAQIGTGAVEMLATDGIVGGEQVASGLSSFGSQILDTEYTLRKNEQTLQFANENYDLQNAIAKTFPPTTKGQALGSALASDLKVGFTVDKMTINYDNAKAIDDYFTMYGYKINKLGIPNRKARPHFTYIKTIDCKVNGGAPSDALFRIQNIYNNGIRFWVDASEIGNYQVDNSPS